MARDKKLHAESIARKYFRTAGIAVLAIFFALTLTGCGEKQTPEAKEMVVWGFVDEDVFKPIIKDFNKKNKVKVTYVKKKLDSNYENNALNSIMSGRGPDVWAIPNDWVYRHKEKLTPLPDSIAKSNKLDVAETFASFVQEDNVFDGKVYGLTPGVDMLQIYYNPTLFNEATQRASTALKSQTDARKEITGILGQFPITWGEFNKVIPWLTVKNGNYVTTGAVAMGTSNNISYPEDILSLLMLQNQTKMISDDLGQASFNLPIKNSTGQEIYPGTNALGFYTSYANPADSNYTWNQSMPNDIQAFIEGKVAMIFNYSDLAGHLNQAYPNFKYTRALVPQIGDFNPITDYASYTTYVVPEISPTQSDAWDFIAQMSTKSYGTYNSATLTLAPTKNTEEKVLASRRSRKGPTKTEIVSGTTWNKGRYPIELDNLFKDAISRVNAGSQSSQASLDTAATKSTELLRKEGW
jgi:ABC-type glycerol-3-phosphate transport system substrate-binding protein